MTEKPHNLKAWVIAVDMGYGHQRTAFPLKSLAPDGKIINANNYDGIPEKDRKIWETSCRFYEFISAFKRVPLMGGAAFAIFNEFQKIFSFYPKRDLSGANFQLKQIFSLIQKGWGKHLILQLRSLAEIHSESSGQVEKPLPLITTFFIPAFMAEFFNYPGEIFCVICDADIARTWASLKPASSRIRYFVPNTRVVERLKLYGIKEENIFLTGYPLPKDNIGTQDLEILKNDLSHRILNLDPKKKYFQQYSPLIKKYLGSLPEKSNHLLTLMFAVGGAGAQKEIGAKILKSLAQKIRNKEVKVILAPGIRSDVKDYFLKSIKRLGLEDNSKNGIDIIFARNIGDYFQKFNHALRTADILWTKPSELSFYTALGFPFIIAPSIGYQEDFNRDWLLSLGSGIIQENPDFTDEWLFDWLDSGLLAEAAMQGFVEGEKSGTLNIEKILNPKS